MSTDSRLRPARTQEKALPSLEEAEARLAAHRRRPTPPWLTPEGLAAMAEAVEGGVPEVSGPAEPGDLPERTD